MPYLRRSRPPYLLLFVASLAWLLGGLLLHPRLASAQEASPTPNPLAAVSAPQAGQTVLGQVTVTGSAALTGFAAYDVAFAHANDPTGTWFLIQRGESPVSGGALAVWDTTTITDGLYDLRLRVFLTSGEVREDIVRAIDVRNYTPTQAPTFTPSPPPTFTPVPVIPTATPTPTRTPPPTPTSLPRNPAALDAPALARTLGYGALAAVGVFILFGLLLSLRRPR